MRRLLPLLAGLSLVTLANPGQAQEEKPPIKKESAAPRVLLFAAGPTREYQFARGIFLREVAEKRFGLVAIHLQSATDKDCDQFVPDEQLLRKFPSALDPLDRPEGANRFANLNLYDVIVAFDPDWSKLSDAQRKLLQRWVAERGGGLVLVAGPVHTYQLARPGGVDLSAIQSLYPVHVNDIRLHGLNITHDPATPFTLNFTIEAREHDFLKLDEKGELPLAGWDTFFGIPWGKDVKKAPARGFHFYYPVERVRPAAAVLATIPLPAARINDGRDEMPMMATMRYGKGTVFYLGSGEMWRLRLYRRAAHERFWVGLARHVAPGTAVVAAANELLVPQEAAVGETITVDARFLDTDGKPLPRGARVALSVVPPLRAKGKPFEVKFGPQAADGPGGWFRAQFRPAEAGEYRLEARLPGEKRPLVRTLVVVAASGECLKDIVAVRQARGIAQWRRLTETVLRAGQRLENSPSAEARALGDALRKVLAQASEDRLQTRLEEAQARLRALRPGNVAELTEAAKRASALADLFQGLERALGKAGQGGASTPGQGLEGADAALAGASVGLQDAAYLLEGILTRAAKPGAEGDADLLRVRVQEVEQALAREGKAVEAARAAYAAAAKPPEGRPSDDPVLRHLDEGVVRPLASILKGDFAAAVEATAALRESLGKKDAAPAAKRAREAAGKLARAVAAINDERAEVVQCRRIAAEVAEAVAEQRRLADLLTRERQRLEAELLKGLLDP
jgi:hypothetical protein